MAYEAQKKPTVAEDKCTRSGFERLKFFKIEQRRKISNSKTLNLVSTESFRPMFTDLKTTFNLGILLMLTNSFCNVSMLQYKELLFRRTYIFVLISYIKI